jgi:hypothetical protein
MVEKLGTLEIRSGKVIASDPCYDSGTWCASEITDVLNGKYIAEIDVIDCDSWGHRVGTLEITHEDYKDRLDECDMDYDSTCGVDSGTFCLSDKIYYGLYHDENLNDEWYDDWVCGMEGYGHIVENYMAMSSSGYGDGGYPVYVRREPKNGYVVSIVVDFLGVYDNEEEEKDFK